jgi:hypothetical protein
MAKLFGRFWTRQELTRYVNTIDQLGGVRLSVLDDGKGRGIRTAQFETGSGLSFTVLLDRGMDIGSTRFKGAALAWESSVGPAHPMYFEKDGLSWHRTWGGGLLNGCGTTSAGAPSEDQGEALGIHGRLSHIPSSNIWADGAWQGDEYEMWVQGKMRETTVKGENVLVERRIWTHLGASRLFIRDVITNEGMEPVPHMMLYHFNFGFPLVAEGTELIAPSQKVTPYVREGAVALDHTRYAAPIDNFQEQAFRHEIEATADGFATLVLANRDFEAGQGLGLYWRYRPAELPHFAQWMLVRAGTYVTALEPHNCAVLNRAKARVSGTLPFLAPGETQEYNFEVGVLANNREIETMASQIRRYPVITQHA